MRFDASFTCCLLSKKRIFAKIIHNPKILLDNPDDATLTVYPNPTDDVLFVELRGGAEIANVALYDLQGRMVGANNHSPLQGGTATIDMKSIPSGVYVLRVTDADGKEYQRKIVRK